MDATEAQQLAAQWIGLATFTIDKYVLPRLDPHTLVAVGGREELVSVGMVELVRAAQHFNPTYISPRTGKPVRFSTFATTFIIRGCWKWINNERKHVKADVEEFDATAGADNSVERGDRQRTIASALAGLSEAEREIVRLRYWESLSLKNVGRRRGTTHEAVRQFEQRILAKLAVTLESFHDAT